MLSVLKYGIGYDLVVNRETGRLVLGIRCHSCGQTSYHPKDVEERYCGACHKFHEEAADRQRDPAMAPFAHAQWIGPFLSPRKYI